MHIGEGGVGPLEKGKGGERAGREGWGCWKGKGEGEQLERFWEGERVGREGGMGWKGRLIII